MYPKIWCDEKFWKILSTKHALYIGRSDRGAAGKPKAGASAVGCQQLGRALHLSSWYHNPDGRHPRPVSPRPRKEDDVSSLNYSSYAAAASSIMYNYI